MSTLFKITFHNAGEVFEVYARQVRSSDIFGFVEFEEFVFGERGGIVIDPSEEKLADQFDGVKRTLVPMHSVVRIDEVDKRGTAKITAAGDSGSKVTPFPVYSRGPGGPGNPGAPKAGPGKS